MRMTNAELLDFQKHTHKKLRAKPKHDEDDLQSQCIEFARFQYPSKLIFMIPNAMSFGGAGPAERGRFFGKLAKLKKMGLMKGVSDLFISEASRGYHGLYLEAKTKIGKQSPEQNLFEKAVKFRGYDYHEFRTFEDFQSILAWYLAP